MAEPGDSSLARSMVHGTLWMVTMRWVIRLIGLINTAILARLLVPEDFALIALAMIAVDLCITVTDGDIDMALVRSSRADPNLQDSGWTLKIIAGGVTAAALWMLAPLIGSYFGDDRIATVIEIAALKPLILGFESIGVVEFRRTLDFSREFRYLVTQRLITFVAVLALVFSWRDYLALAWAMPLSAAVTVSLSYWMAPRRPRLCLSHWRALWHFSRWQMLFNSARLVGERCDQFVISRVGTLHDTGLYVVGFDLALMPCREIMLPAGRALMPVYARIADDPEALTAHFRAVLGFAAIIASAIGLGMSSVAEDAVALLLGPQWSAAVPFVRWLGVFGALEGMWLMLDPVLIATGRERALAVSNLAFAALTVPAVAATAWLAGLEFIPAARIAVMTVVLGVVLGQMVRWGWLNTADLLASLWRPLAAAAVMVTCIEGTHGLIFTAAAGSLLADVTVGAVSYGASLFLLWQLSGRPAGAERLLAGLALERIGRGER